jgi:hypothetical protein
VAIVPRQTYNGKRRNIMRKTIFVGVLIVGFTGIANAESRSLLGESIDESRQRHSAENYEVYKNNGYQAPLGGYSEPLGDTAPKGTERPGYTSPKGGYNYSSPYNRGK